MSGPAVGLWLFEARRCEDVIREVAPWLETFCEPIETEPDGVTFWVRDVEPLGMEPEDLADACAFFLNDDDYLPADDEDYSTFPQAPLAGLVLAAGCSGQINHRVLGHLALALACKLGALIDFDGVLGYPSPQDETRVAAELAHARELVADLPGRVEEVSYATGAGGRWFRHVGDTEFLTAWLRHPQFRLVK